MFRRRADDGDSPIVVPDKIRRRARKAASMGLTPMWVDQTLYLIGRNVTHHEKGDPLLDEAIDAGYALLALMVEMKERESIEL